MSNIFVVGVCDVPQSTNTFMVKAFRKLGHNVTVYNYRTVLKKLSNNQQLLGEDFVATLKNEKDIDLAAASLYFTLAAHPELKEGSFTVKYNGAQLRIMAKDILKKYDMDEATVDGEAIW